MSPTRNARIGTSISLLLLLLGVESSAQWIGYQTKGIPRTADGKPNLSAPAPRTADGKPDLAGVWQATSDPNDPAGGIEGIVGPKYLINILRDYKVAPMTAWAAGIYKQRNDDKLQGSPMIRCLPAGVPRLDAYPAPFKIVQTRDLVVILYESQTLFRQIFLDGRAHPKDPQPTWLGYSIGKWDGDILVVETVGFNDKTWLDGLGHPHSEAMRLTERFRRRDFGHMDIEITIEDPKAYTTAIRYVQPQALLVDGELIEYICNENAKPVG
jgi:hypothetical protein